MKLTISATLVIRKWSHAISKYNEATPGGYFFPEMTTANHSLPCPWKLPIHTFCFDPCSLWCVHMLHTTVNKQNTLSGHFTATVSSCCCLFHSHRKGVYALRGYNTHMNKQEYPSQDMSESQTCSSDVLPEQSNTTPLQNHYTDLESNEYHNTCKGKVSKCTWHAQTSSYCTLIYTKSEFLRTINIHTGKCHTQWCAHHYFCFP
jgi:hypothetical protein